MIAQFGRFAVVGVLGTALDFALLWALLRVGLWQPAAVSVAYVTATAAQFVANRYYSFRAFDRPPIEQARTYAIVSAINWGIALAFVQLGTAVFALAPLWAKALSIPPSIAVSFFANRHLTFGGGIRAAARELLRRWRG